MNEVITTLESGIATAAPKATLTNEKLAAHTNAIYELMTATKRNMFEIAARLLIINKEELYKDDNYKDVFDYANKVLGYKKNFVYKLTAAAEKYIEHAATGDGYVSILVHDNSDYTVSQLIELNGVESDTAISLDENGVITPEMTTKEIREVVKDFKNGVIDVEGNKLETETETETETESDGETTGGNENEEIDTAAVAIQDIMNACDVLMKDERVIKDVNFLKKITAFKKVIEKYEI